MLSEVFYWTLNMSIIGTLMGGILLLVRKVRFLPRQAVYLLWVIPLIRLVIPFGISSRFSLMNIISTFATRTVVLYSSDHSPSLVLSNFFMAAKDYSPIAYKTPALETVFHIFSLIWLVLCVALLITVLLLYYFTKTEMRNAVRIRDNIYSTDRINTPAIYGIIHPKIIIPVNMVDMDMKYILLHENVHLKRKDNLFRCIAILTACLHWFNPMVWVLLKFYFQDMETSCDAKVLSRLGDKEKTPYALSLLDCATRKNLFVSSFGGAKITIRIENILSYKKVTLVSGLFFALLIAAMAVVLLTNSWIS